MLLFLLGNSADSLYAQEITFSGVGPINHSLAGTAAALPRDSAGAIYWNPATISHLEYSELQFGLGRHNALWYGDECVVLAPVAVLLFTLWLISDHDDDQWDTPNSNKKNEKPPPSPKKTKKPVIRVPTLSYLYRPTGSRWSYGLGISEYGATKIHIDALGDTFGSDDAIGITEYRFQGYEFMPTIAYRESRHFSVGFSPLFSIDEMPNATLPVIPFNQYTGIAQHQRSKAGVGMQLGVYYAPTRRTRFGVSVRTPLLISRYTYRWINPVTGDLHTQRLSFSQDSAFRIVVGASRTLRNDKTTFSADFRYADYSHASALYDIPASFDPAVKPQGNSRAVYSLAVSGEHHPWDILAFRMGYQWNHALTPDRSVIYNTGLPIQSGHSIHYGLTAFFSAHFDISWSVSHAFGGGETFFMEEQSIRFRRNPNRSNFWIAARFRF